MKTYGTFPSLSKDEPALVTEDTVHEEISSPEAGRQIPLFPLASSDGCLMPAQGLHFASDSSSASERT
jgi:hypothetical protein